MFDTIYVCPDDFTFSGLTMIPFGSVVACYRNGIKLLDGNAYFIETKFDVNDARNELGYLEWGGKDHWTEADRAENNKRRDWADDTLGYEECAAMSHFLKYYNEYLIIVNSVFHPRYYMQPYMPYTPVYGGSAAPKVGQCFDTTGRPLP